MEILIVVVSIPNKDYPPIVAPINGVLKINLVAIGEDQQNCYLLGPAISALMFHF